MGAWDSGNFDNDTACDFLVDIVKQLDEEMRLPIDIELIDLLMGAVAIRKVLVEHFPASLPPARKKMADLKLAVLQLYDDEIDSLEPQREYKTKRRQVIEKTFEDFLNILE